MLACLLLASSAAFAGGRHQGFRSTNSSMQMPPLMKVAPRFTTQKQLTVQKQPLMKVAPRFTGRSQLSTLKVAPNKNWWMNLGTPQTKSHKKPDPKRPDDRVLIPNPISEATLIATTPKAPPVIRDHTVTKPTPPPDYSNPPTVTGGSGLHFTDPFSFTAPIRPGISDHRTPKPYRGSGHAKPPEPWTPNTQGPANQR